MVVYFDVDIVKLASVHFILSRDERIEVQRWMVEFVMVVVPVVLLP
jgi:hypothetical protein